MDLRASGLILNVNWLQRAGYGNPNYIFTLVNMSGDINQRHLNLKKKALDEALKQLY